MNLRTKLILILTVIVIITSMTASMIIYFKASSELEERAKHRLTSTAVLLAESIQIYLNSNLRKLEYWADMPLVINTALSYKHSQAQENFQAYFSSIIDREPYSSIYLIHRKGECVASDDPRRVFHPHCLKVVSKLPSALSGFSGTANIGHSSLSKASGQPLVPLTAPVRHREEVVAILRTSVDMGRLSREALVSFNLQHKERIYLFDPELAAALPDGLKLHTPTNRQSYRPPPEVLRTAFAERTGPTFHYDDSGEKFLATFATMENPKWFILVVQPISEITAPIKALSNVTLFVFILTCVLLIASILFITAPVVKGIEQCRKFAAEISYGHLDQRLTIQSSDEVGELAQDLNEMAIQLQSTHHNLQDAERKYREIFKNSVEGLFQTNKAGILLAANSKLADLLAAPSANSLIGNSILHFYQDHTQRTRLLSRLLIEGEINDFDCDIIRMDGISRQVILHARADLDAQRQIQLIHGSVEDVTNLRKAEAKARRVREAEALLLKTELEMLRYQVNPHFLFNTLNSIRELVLTEPAESVDMIEALASFYHACLIHRSRPLSSVTEEFNRIRMYLKIQKCRFGSNLEVSIEVAPEVEPVTIPIFILQPIVENAIKFGKKSGKQTLQIRIRAFIKDEKCEITIANTGRWFKPDTTSDSQGPQLGSEYVKQSLAHQYGEEATFDIREDNQWVTAQVVFPIKEKQQDE